MLTLGMNTVAPAAIPETTQEPTQLSAGVEDVLKLTRAKVSDDVTIAFVQSGDRHYNLSASEILYLRKEGVSDRVLEAILSRQSPQSVAPTAPNESPPPPPTASTPATAQDNAALQYASSYALPGMQWTPLPRR